MNNTTDLIYSFQNVRYLSIVQALIIGLALYLICLLQYIIEDSFVISQ